MNTNHFIIATIIVVACLTLIIYRHKKKSSVSTPSHAEQTKVETIGASEKTDDLGCNISIFDDNGLMVLESREIEKIPTRAHFVESSDSALSRVKHLASDLFKGSTSISNKTIEVVFKPEIHQGLADGTYTLMKTKSGEVLADAINASNKKIVGKGRLIQGGKARQLASGAFQLVSIAVAQSHLADIERNLSAIKHLISEMIERQENKDRANITGALDYLSEITTYMEGVRGPDELPQQKRNAIEGVIKDSYTWRNKLEEDLTSLINQISDLTKSDTFGTGDTFQQLKTLIEKIKPLLKRRELFLNLASAINFVTAYLDPAQREYSRLSVNEVHWTELIDNFKSVVLDRESALMGTSLWNSNETLQLRKDKLRSLSADYCRIGYDQQNDYLKVRNTLTDSMSRLLEPSGDVRIAIAFDDHGVVGSAAII